MRHHYNCAILLCTIHTVFFSLHKYESTAMDSRFRPVLENCQSFVHLLPLAQHSQEKGGPDTTCGEYCVGYGTFVLQLKDLFICWHSLLVRISTIDQVWLYVSVLNMDFLLLCVLLWVCVYVCVRACVRVYLRACACVYGYVTLTTAHHSLKSSFKISTNVQAIPVLTALLALTKSTALFASV